MSIQEAIQGLKQDGRLMPLLPRAPGTSARRALLVCEGLWPVLAGPWEAQEDEVRFMTLRADLDVFSEGRLITPSYLFQLTPRRDETWEIKSPRPRPVLRVFGRFADKDVLIATNLGNRAELGKWGSREWRGAIETCKAEWRRLFPTWEPLRKGSIHDYVSNAIDGKYYK